MVNRYTNICYTCRRALATNRVGIPEEKLFDCPVCIVTGKNQQLTVLDTNQALSELQDGELAVCPECKHFGVVVKLSGEKKKNAALDELKCPMCAKAGKNINLIIKGKEEAYKLLKSG